MTLSGFSCGDNCYLELTRGVEGAAPETILCTAPACAEWQAGGSLPAALRDTGAMVRFGTADQVDGSGTVMEHGVRAAVGLRIPTKLRQAATRASPGGTGPLPLTRGVYVADGSDCAHPANAVVRVYDGQGISGSTTKDCRVTVNSRDRSAYRVSNSCVNTYDGSRAAVDQTVTVPEATHFALDGTRFGLCPAGEAPESLRTLTR